MGTRRRGATPRLRSALYWSYCAYLGALALIVAVLQGARPRSGSLALAVAFAPYLIVPAIAGLPLLLTRPGWVRRLILCCCLIVTIGPLCPAIAKRGTTDPAAGEFTLLSWNINLRNTAPGDAGKLLLGRPADIVVLQEDYGGVPLGAYAEALQAVYPHQVRHGRGAPPGLSIMSAYPIIDFATVDDRLPEEALPPVAWARIDLGQGRTVIIVAAHASRPGLAACPVSPTRCFDTARRDEQLAQIRATIAPLLETGEPLLLAGDFNLTDREPAYRELADGLQDVFLTAGSGVGHTWGPRSILRRGGAILRIDYLLANGQLTARGFRTDCAFPGSDHCSIIGGFTLR